MNSPQDEHIVIELLKQTGLPIVDAAILVKQLVQESGGGGRKLERARKCIELGAISLRNREYSVTFSKCVREALAVRIRRRPRTLSDFRFIIRRFLRLCPGLERRDVRSITPEECKSYIETAFVTQRQRHKARLVLSGVFSTAVKRGWCAENPVFRVDSPYLDEHPIRALSLSEVDTLLKSASVYDHGSCLAAVGMMLFGGIRPHEVCRLTWNDVDLEGSAILLRPRHTKTGGARHVTIRPVLDAILRCRAMSADFSVCPPNWRRKWRELRQLAGWNGKVAYWQPDCLRHTFASYHLKMFGNYNSLQLEMGHRDTNLLRTRYVNMEGLTRRDAELFWRERPCPGAGG